MSGLRERQKAARQKEIALAARDMFIERGFENTTIEEIAEIAGVSGVTVHNYYGTKAGILLSLVSENDKILIAKLNTGLSHCRADIIEATVEFSRIIMEHALETLQKVIWRQVIATVTANSDNSISKPYFDLDQELAQVLIKHISRLQVLGALPESTVAEHLGKALFHLQNARFIQFVCSDELQIEDILRRIQNDLEALFSVHVSDQSTV